MGFCSKKERVKTGRILIDILGELHPQISGCRHAIQLHAERLAYPMATSTRSVIISDDLLHQVELLAERHGISQNQVFEMALEQFLAQYQAGSSSATPIMDGPRMIHQGDIYWVGLDGSHAEIRHPYVVIQDNVLNHSRLSTVVVCALTSNLHRASLPGNVLLDTNEGNLPKSSVVEVSKVSAVDKSQLGEYIGSLSQKRVNQILDGMRFLQSSFFPRP